MMSTDKYRRTSWQPDTSHVNTVLGAEDEDWGPTSSTCKGDTLGDSSAKVPLEEMLTVVYSALLNIPTTTITETLHHHHMPKMEKRLKAKISRHMEVQNWVTKKRSWGMKQYSKMSLSMTLPDKQFISGNKDEEIHQGSWGQKNKWPVF